MDIKIFIINLESSTNRKSAMIEKIRKIQGFNIFLEDKLIKSETRDFNAKDFKNYQNKIMEFNLDSKVIDSSDLKTKDIDSTHLLDSILLNSMQDISLDSANTKDFTPNLYFYFFKATNAKDVENKNIEIPNYKPKLMRLIKGKELRSGEIACFHSHFRLWQKCLKLGSPIIVLEDDIDFMPNFSEIINIYNSPFCYVRLYYLFERKVKQIKDNFYISFGKIAGTQGYYLMPNAAKKFIDKAKNYIACVDDYMDMFFIHNVPNIIYKPFIISEDKLFLGSSDIEGREKTKIPFFYKISREIARIYFHIFKKSIFLIIHKNSIKKRLDEFKRTH